jgi:hypothetical protein
MDANSSLTRSSSLGQAKYRISVSIGKFLQSRALLSFWISRYRSWMAVDSVLSLNLPYSIVTKRTNQQWRYARRIGYGRLKMATSTRSSRLSESWRVILTRVGMCDRCGKPGKQRAIKPTADQVARSPSRVCLCDECYQSLNALHAMMWVWLRKFLYLHPDRRI